MMIWIRFRIRKLVLCYPIKDYGRNPTKRGWSDGITNHFRWWSQTMRVYEINPNLILFWNQTLRHYLYTDFAKKFSLDNSSSSVSNSGRALICVPFTLEKIQNETGYGSSMRQLPHRSDTDVVDRCDSVGCLGRFFTSLARWCSLMAGISCA